MTTTSTIVLVAGGLGAVYLFTRSQAMQAQQLAAASSGGVPASGGGLSGLAGRLFQQFKSDPLGIQNTKAVVGTVTGVARTAATEVGGVVHDIVGGIRGIF